MNETILLISAILSSIFVLIAWRAGKERLYSAIIVFLILIAAVGGKIVEFFGFETNTGTIFYASVFLATYFLIERYGSREGIRSIWIGAIAVLAFSALARITSAYIGSPTTAELDAALAVAFTPLVRVTFASLAAYAISQSLNVYLYIHLKRRMKGAYLWVRANVANALAQLVDSTVFFVIAFAGVVPLSSMGEVLLTGFVVKVIFMMLASPLLYLNTMEESEDDEGNAVIAVR